MAQKKAPPPLSPYKAEDTDGKQYMFFIGKPVCSCCGTKGHLAGSCSSAYCGSCRVYGHEVGSCHLVCQTCKKDHSNPGTCRLKKECRECGLWGHTHADCPAHQCSRCGCYGHRGSDCVLRGQLASKISRAMAASSGHSPASSSRAGVGRTSSSGASSSSGSSMHHSDWRSAGAADANSSMSRQERAAAQVAAGSVPAAGSRATSSRHGAATATAAAAAAADSRHTGTPSATTAAATASEQAAAAVAAALAGSEQLGLLPRRRHRQQLALQCLHQYSSTTHSEEDDGLLYYSSSSSSSCSSFDGTMFDDTQLAAGHLSGEAGEQLSAINSAAADALQQQQQLWFENEQLDQHAYPEQQQQQRHAVECVTLHSQDAETAPELDPAAGAHGHHVTATAAAEDAKEHEDRDLAEMLALLGVQ